MTRRTAKQRRQPIAVNSNETPLCIEFVLDETGSMSRISAQTVAGFNDFLSEQRKLPGECRMSLIKFSGNDLRIPYQDLELNYVPDMNANTFCANGGTNLYDAIGHRASDLDKRLAKWTSLPRVLFVVMTDGQDNTSRMHNHMSIRSIVEKHPEWTFVYLGADQNALHIGNEMGFPDGNIKSFASNEIRSTMQNLSAATTVFRASSTATQSFF
jgi:uncharacterized protein YegL